MRLEARAAGDRGGDGLTGECMRPGSGDREGPEIAAACVASLGMGPLPLLLRMRHRPASRAGWALCRRALSTVSLQSDNCRGAMPEVLAALLAANSPAAVPSYGSDDLSAQAADAVRGFLGCHPAAAVLPTISGIASVSACAVILPLNSQSFGTGNSLVGAGCSRPHAVRAPNQRRVRP